MSSQRIFPREFFLTKVTLKIRFKKRCMRFSRFMKLSEGSEGTEGTEGTEQKDSRSYL
jgi:hypothetical protein